MPRIAWLTDVHLNFLSPMQVDDFLAGVARAQVDAVAITGDIAEAHSLLAALRRFEEVLNRPTYFVLGNHDFYGGELAQVRRQVTEFCHEHPQLVYLTDQAEPLALTDQVALVGTDGWADGRLGNYETSIVQMTDWRVIRDFVGMGKRARLELLHQLGDESAAHLRGVLTAALKSYSRVIVLTHVPPLREACWHEGQHSDDQWAPHFTCKAVGDVLLDLARRNPSRQIDVYCGHTHGAGQCQPLPNLQIVTGGAEYGWPKVQQVWEV